MEVEDPSDVGVPEAVDDASLVGVGTVRVTVKIGERVVLAVICGGPVVGPL